MSKTAGRTDAKPSSTSVSQRMQRQARRNTAPERALRSALHRAGLRFRVHRRPIPGLRREADIVFPGARVAVFVDGCFWHGCPEHATWPKANDAWWREKIEGNRSRDEATDAELRRNGWKPIRVWEHEDPLEAAKTIAVQVRQTRDSWSSYEGSESASRDAPQLVGMARIDANTLLKSLRGKTIATLSRGKPNTILQVEGSRVYVGTQKTPSGEPVPISEVQAALDRLAAGEEVEVNVDSLGHRSAFIGAVLAQVPGTAVLPSQPRRVRLR